MNVQNEAITVNHIFWMTTKFVPTFFLVKPFDSRSVDSCVILQELIECDQVFSLINRKTILRFRNCFS